MVQGGEEGGANSPSGQGRSAGGVCAAGGSRDAAAGEEGPPAQTGSFLWDSSSGYYYDPASKFFWDPRTGLYGDSRSGIWYHWDGAALRPCPAGGAAPSEASKRRRATAAAKAAVARLSPATSAEAPGGATRIETPEGTIHVGRFRGRGGAGGGTHTTGFRSRYDREV